MSDDEIVARIEALSRAEFRAAVNAERRSTLAIGAFVLAWGQFDSTLGSMLQLLGVERYPVGPDDQLAELRRQFEQRDPTRLSDLDRIIAGVRAAAPVRNDLAHGVLGLSSPDGSADKLQLFCAPYRRPKGRAQRPAPQMAFHLISEIFRLADQLYEDRKEMEKLTRAVLA